MGGEGRPQNLGVPLTTPPMSSPPQATYDPSHGYSPQPVDLSGVTLSRELQVRMAVSPVSPVSPQSPPVFPQCPQCHPASSSVTRMSLSVPPVLLRPPNVLITSPPMSPWTLSPLCHLVYPQCPLVFPGVPRPPKIPPNPPQTTPNPPRPWQSSWLRTTTTPGAARRSWSWRPRVRPLPKLGWDLLGHSGTPWDTPKPKRNLAETPAPN